MSKLVMLVGAVVAALGLAVAGPASERGLSPHPAEARTPALTVTVACKATPETTRVKNNLNRAITIRAVGSIYRPFGYEPVRVERKLGAGKTVAFESGAGADRNKLSGSFIYNNDVGSREGARVRTSVGAFTDKCTGPAEKVALTFDDGPDPTPKNTPSILNILKSKGVKATFFVVGQRVNQYPELVSREYAEGHRVENHSYTHPDLTKLSNSQVNQELADTNAAIVAAGVPKPDLFRPPYGYTNATVKSIGASLGLTQTLWTYDPKDWENPPASTICDRVVNNVKPNGIVALHDKGTANTDDALPCIIDGLRARGYTFGQVYPSSVSPSGVEVR